MLSQHPEQLNHNQAGPLLSPAADEIVILSEFPQRRWCCLAAVLRSTTRNVLALRLLKIQNMFAQIPLLSTNVLWVNSRSPPASFSRAHLLWDPPKPSSVSPWSVWGMRGKWVFEAPESAELLGLAFGTNPKPPELWLGGKSRGKFLFQANYKRKKWEARFSEVPHIPCSPQKLDVDSFVAVKRSCLLSSPSPLAMDSLRPWECVSRSCKPQEICQSLSFPDTSTTFHVPQRNYPMHPLPGWGHRKAHFPQKINFPLK